MIEASIICSLLPACTCSRSMTFLWFICFSGQVYMTASSVTVPLPARHWWHRIYRKMTSPCKCLQIRLEYRSKQMHICLFNALKWVYLGCITIFSQGLGIHLGRFWEISNKWSLFTFAQNYVGTRGIVTSSLVPLTRNYQEIAFNPVIKRVIICRMLGMKQTPYYIDFCGTFFACALLLPMLCWKYMTCLQVGMWIFRYCSILVEPVLDKDVCTGILLAVNKQTSSQSHTGVEDCFTEVDWCDWTPVEIQLSFYVFFPLLKSPHS